MSEKLEKTLEEINELMKQVNDLQKEEPVEEEKAEYMDTDEESSAEGEKLTSDTDTPVEEEDEELTLSNFDSEAKGRTGPEGFVEAGLIGEESQGKKLPQAAQVGPLYIEWKNDDFSTLDLSTANVEKAYEAFKAEQLEKMAYESLKKQFETRFIEETSVRKADVARREYDAKNEVETLREEFATLRKSLEDRNDAIAKSQTVEIPEVDVSEMSWNDIHSFVSKYEE